MKVLLINIDSKIPNLALCKIEKYHKDRGDEIIWNLPIMKYSVDKIYVSCIFNWNNKLCEEWEGRAEIGGSGYDLIKKLPPEIEAVNPRINLGFTTRGCIRNCSFCIVPKKEGGISVVGDIYDLWNGNQYFINKKGKKQRTILTILDNNILMFPEHFKLICSQLRKEKLCVDFNQGLDHRLLTQDIIKDMRSISHIEYRFAFDHPSYLPTVEKAIALLQKNKINRCSWYVLVGFDTTFEQDLMRIKYLKEHNQNAFVQRYKTVRGDKKYIALARWVNQHHIFQMMTFEQFLDLPKNGKMRIRTVHYENRQNLFLRWQGV